LEYQTLYEIWKREKESIELQPLSKGFYAELSNLVRAEREEAQMLDERSLRSQLFQNELAKIKKILTDLIECRFRKALQMILSGSIPGAELLASEEESIIRGISATKAQVEMLLRSVLEGRLPQIIEDVKGRQSRVVIRLLQDMPAIIGTNTSVYGPFKAEDIAALPLENAESLIKRGVAVRVEPE
jgi:DNA replication factor GINS